MINIVIITFLIVSAYDMLNFPRELLSRIYSLVFRRYISPSDVKLPKLLDCSLCMTFWSTLIYQLFFTEGMLLEKAAISMLMALSTPYIYSGLGLVNNAIRLLISYAEKGIDILWKKIN